MESLFTIGIDVGGTFVKGGILSAAGELVRREVIDSHADEGYEALLDRIKRFVERLIKAHGLSHSNIAGVGLGCPGPVATEEGIVRNAPNLTGWRNVPVRDDLSRMTGLLVSVDNDANSAAFGEYSAGVGDDDGEDMVMLTLGTGVGGGIIIGGELQRGSFGTIAEIGHMIVQPRGRACPCGQHGCLERYASARAIADRVIEALNAGEESSLQPTNEDGERLNSRDVAAAAADGDELARRIWDEACNYLAIACINLQHICNPRRIVLGGGLVGAGEQLRGPIISAFEAQTWKLADDRPEIVFGELGEDAGVIGAAALARVRSNRISAAG